jgi:oligopeptide transport system substrate-binding protein
MEKRKNIFILIGIIILLILAYLIYPYIGKKEKIEEKILYEAIYSQPQSFDPRDSVDAETYGIMYTIYNTLVEIDDSLKVQPAIAYKWDTKDFKEWKFYIRDDVYFKPDSCFGENNKKKLTAYDVEFSLNRALQPGGTGAFMLTDIVEGAQEVNDGKAQKASGIKVLDDHTLLITLKKPYRKLLERLAMPFFFIVSKDAVECYKDKYSLNPVGTGAYMIEKIDPGNAIYLKKNPYFWKKDEKGKKLPYLDGIVFRIIKNPQLAINEFIAGKLSAVEIQPVQSNLVFNDKGELKDEFKKFKIAENVALDVHYFAFKMDEEPFKNNKVLRQAINYAIDKDAIVNNILNRFAIPAVGVLPPSVYSEVKRGPVYKFNLELAKKMIKEANIDTSKIPPITLYIDNKPTTEAVAQFVQSSLNEIGIRVNLKKMDFSTLLGEVIQGNSKFYYMYWEGTDPNPEIFMVQFKSDLLPEKGGYNFGRYSNSKADELYDKAVSSLDENEAKNYWLELESLLVDDAPWVFLYHTKRVRLLQPNIKNYDNNPMQIRRYYTTKIE